jgi:hypothetical protein
MERKFWTTNHNFGQEIVLKFSDRTLYQFWTGTETSHIYGSFAELLASFTAAIQTIALPHLLQEFFSTY